MNTEQDSKQWIPTKYRQGKPSWLNRNGDHARRKNPLRGLAVPNEIGMASNIKHTLIAR